MVDWCRDSDAQRWFDWPAHIPSSHEADCRKIVEGWSRDWARGERAPFAVHLGVDALSIGSVELHRTARESWYLSYLIHPDWRRKGIAARAATLACSWGFEELHMDSVFLETGIENIASQRVAASAGFRDTGKRHESGPIEHYVPEQGQLRAMATYQLKADDLLPRSGALDPTILGDEYASLHEVEDAAFRHYDEAEAIPFGDVGRDRGAVAASADHPLGIA